MMKTVYDFTVKDRLGQDVSLSDYRGKVLLIVNTATGCGFTPHYKPIEQMYSDFHDKGFEVIDIPCNQFKGQHLFTPVENVFILSIQSEVHSFKSIQMTSGPCSLIE